MSRKDTKHPKKPVYKAYSPKNPPVDRGTRRNRERPPMLETTTPKKPRPKQEPVVHVVQVRKVKAVISGPRRTEQPPHPPTYCSHATYKSKQAERREINKVSEEGSTPKSRRNSRQGRKQHH